ncbi:MAG: MerR family transcriptional regulator [Acidobacteriota bacterium]
MAKKLFYKIGEACKLLDIQPYVLRYWETEFPFLAPAKSKSGQRTYSQDELDVIRRIKELLYDEGYTIAGAKKKLEAELTAGEQPAGGPSADDGASSIDHRRVSRLEAELAETRKLLARAEKASEAEAETSEVVRRAAAESETRSETLRDGVESALAQAHDLLERLGGAADEQRST